jgi:hypothetical protein
LLNIIEYGDFLEMPESQGVHHCLIKIGIHLNNQIKNIISISSIQVNLGLQIAYLRRTCRIQYRTGCHKKNLETILENIFSQKYPHTLSSENHYWPQHNNFKRGRPSGGANKVGVLNILFLS